MGACDLRQARTHAPGEAHERLAARRRIVGAAIEVMLVVVGVARRDLVMAQAVPESVVLLAQLRPLRQGQAAPRSMRARRRHGARKVARIDAIERALGELLVERRRLHAALVVQSDIELTLETPLEIPIRLAMTGEAEQRAGHVGWVFRKGGRPRAPRNGPRLAYRPICAAWQVERPRSVPFRLWQSVTHAGDLTAKRGSETPRESLGPRLWKKREDDRTPHDLLSQDDATREGASPTDGSSTTRRWRRRPDPRRSRQQCPAFAGRRCRI